MRHEYAAARIRAYPSRHIGIHGGDSEDMSAAFHRPACLLTTGALVALINMNMQCLHVALHNNSVIISVERSTCTCVSSP